MAGIKESASPLKTLLASLTDCENAIANFVVKEMDFDLLGIEFDVQSEPGPNSMMGKGDACPYFQTITVKAIKQRPSSLF
ncbi:hypothetical protein [Marinococcus halophilus]|nr:hypothetical protein [Marinococcus halophilus]